MNRRDIFKGIGVLGVLATGTAIAEKQKEDISHLAPDMDQGNLGLTYLDASLDIAVGKDGYLWIRPNGKDAWKRVTTE